MVMLGDEMTRILEEAAEGLAILENEVITAEFDPTDPVSVEAAVAHVESASHLHSPLRILVAETVKTLSKHWLAL